MTVVSMTVLWALRSPCNLGCAYCYFGVLEEDRERMRPVSKGELSHVRRDDLRFEELRRVVDGISRNGIRRIFLAGGEPLIWRHTLDLIEHVKSQGIEVVVCLNGL